MKDFFQIVPLLIGGMMDHRLLHKDKLLRQGHDGKSVIHTYDSFLLGVAFVLKVTSPVPCLFCSVLLYLDDLPGDWRMQFFFNVLLLCFVFWHYLQVLKQESSFDELNLFTSTKTKFEGVSEDKDNKMDTSPSRAAFTSLKLWHTTPSVRTEPHKVLSLWLSHSLCLMISPYRTISSIASAKVSPVSEG